MKASNSSSYSSSSLPNVMIPKFQQLLPIETQVSGNWISTQYSSEILSTANKLLSPPISITPSSMCTDSSEGEYQPIDLSSSSSSLRKYSFSSPPLSNIKSESIDLVDCCISSFLPEESTMIISNNQKNFYNKPSLKLTKQCTNFSIEHLLSSSYRSPTYQYLSISRQQINSIFTKKKTKHFSDNYLHQIIHYKKKFSKKSNSYLSQNANKPRGLFIRYIFDLYYNLIGQQNQINNGEKFSNIDALEQLAEIACKLDTHYKTLKINENKLTSKNYEILLKQCHLLIKQIYQKYQHKKNRKRLSYNSKIDLQKRFLHFSLSILNILQRKLNILLHGTNHFNCHLLMPDIQKYSIKNQMETNNSICFHVNLNDIKSNRDILIPNDGLLYEATTQLINDYDDLLLVRLNHERQTYLIPIHDLCRLACPKMVPESFDILSKGSRVCAYWSTSLRGLHPAIVKKLPSDVNESSLVGLLFDDGDTGLIKLDEIRLLPDNFHIKGVVLEEWRVSSFQIPSNSSIKRRTCRHISSNTSHNTNVPSKKTKRSSIVVPQWTLNVRNSIICRHDKKETIQHGDCIVLHGIDKSLSYIGKVLKFYRNKSTQQDFVRLIWYYSPQETSAGLHENDLPGALYESTHIDENLIATIRYKGTIFESYDDYVNKTDHGKNRKETDFYLVGHYNPTTGELKRFDDQ